MTHATDRDSRPFTRLSGREPWPTSSTRRATLEVSGNTLRIASGIADIAADAARLVGLPFDLDFDVPDRLARWHDRQDWPERPLRIGLVGPGAWAAQLVETPGILPVEWFGVPSERGHNPQSLRSHHLDACIRALPDEGFEIVTSEHVDKDAAWFDWGSPRPLSFPGVFAARLDPARVTLPTADTGDLSLIRTLAEAAALLSRHPERLTLSDRLSGRRPVLPTPEPLRRVARYTPVRDGFSELAGRMVTELSRFRHGAIASPAERAASRVVSAWACMWPGDHDEESRRIAAETAARVTSDEPETMLRLAASRFGAMDDSAGLEALARAERLLRGRDLVGTDQTAFLSAELDAGIPGARTTGRIAVGVCLVTATLPVEKLAYFAEDLADDLSHAAALVGRDQDHRLILEVIRTVEANRRAESPAGPVSKAA